jgi:hypothetical protein
MQNLKNLKNLKAGLLGLSFLIWILTSLFNPIQSLFKEPTIYEYVIGFNSLIVTSFLLITVIPKTIKRDKTKLSDLNFKNGSTKNEKTGCKSCKRKKRF